MDLEKGSFLVWRVFPSDLQDLIDSSRHAENQRLDEWLRNSFPIFTKSRGQLSETSGRGIALSDSASYFVPKVFNRIEVRAPCWPFNPSNTATLNKFTHKLRTMCWRVIILKSPSHLSRSTQLFCPWKKVILEDLCVALSIQGSWEDLQGTFTIIADSSPD